MTCLLQSFICATTVYNLYNLYQSRRVKLKCAINSEKSDALRRGVFSTSFVKCSLAYVLLCVSHSYWTHSLLWPVLALKKVLMKWVLPLESRGSNRKVGTTAKSGWLYFRFHYSIIKQSPDY